MQPLHQRTAHIGLTRLPVRSCPPNCAAVTENRQASDNPALAPEAPDTDGCMHGSFWLSAASRRLCEFDLACRAGQRINVFTVHPCQSLHSVPRLESPCMRHVSLPMPVAEWTPLQESRREHNALPYDTHRAHSRAALHVYSYPYKRASILYGPTQLQSTPFYATLPIRPPPPLHILTPSHPIPPHPIPPRPTPSPPHPAPLHIRLSLPHRYPTDSFRDPSVAELRCGRPLHGGSRQTS